MRGSTYVSVHCGFLFCAMLRAARQAAPGRLLDTPRVVL